MDKSIINSIANALPEESSARDDLIALAVVTTGVIQSVDPEGRPELIEKFCELIRKNAALDLN